MDADATYKRIEAAAVRVVPAIAADRVAHYRRRNGPKAIAIHVETARTFSAWGAHAVSPGVAEVLALEGCQQSYGSPCILLAVGNELRAPDPARAPERDMPRLHANGPFLPENVPFVTASNIPDLRNYASLPGRKALAIRAVSTRVNIVSGTASIADAEQQALAACNNDPELAYPCFIYASGDRVVLPERRTEALP